MLYQRIKKIIDGGNYDIEVLSKQLDVFFLANRLTETQYTELIGLIKKGAVN